MYFQIDLTNPHISFQYIAEQLFSEYYISTANSNYFITEIEFYFQSSDHHNDNYTHGHKFQKLNGHWYFHWSGIDITIGDGINKGGILIRGLKKKDINGGWEYISGPLNVMRELLSGQHNAFSERGIKLQLVKSSKIDIGPIFIGKRVGLNNEKDTRESYYDKPYRFLIDNVKQHKFAYKGTIKKL